MSGGFAGAGLDALLLEARGFSCSVLRELAALFKQVHALPSDVPATVQRAGLKPTHTPSVLMSRGRLNIQAAKVISLPEPEREERFDYLWRCSRWRMSVGERRSVLADAAIGGTAICPMSSWSDDCFRSRSVPGRLRLLRTRFDE